MKYIIILIGLIGFCNAQSIDEALNSGDVEVLDKLEAELNGDFQKQINALRLDVEELKNLIKSTPEVKEESEGVKKFKYYMAKGKDYTYIYQQFNKAGLIQIIKELNEANNELNLSTEGYKKDLAKRIEKHLKK